MTAKRSFRPLASGCGSATALPFVGSTSWCPIHESGVGFPTPCINPNRSFRSVVPFGAGRFAPVPGPAPSTSRTPFSWASAGGRLRRGSRTSTLVCTAGPDVAISRHRASHAGSASAIVDRLRPPRSSRYVRQSSDQLQVACRR